MISFCDCSLRKLTPLCLLARLGFFVKQRQERRLGSQIGRDDASGGSSMAKCEGDSGMEDANEMVPAVLVALRIIAIEDRIMQCSELKGLRMTNDS